MFAALNLCNEATALPPAQPPMPSGRALPVSCGVVKNDDGCSRVNRLRLKTLHKAGDYQGRWGCTIYRRCRPA